MSEKELIWVPVEIARKLEAMTDDHAQIERVLDDFVANADREMEINLEALDNRVIEYKAILIKSRAAFSDACDDSAEKSEELFLNWDEKMPSVRQKVDAIRAEIGPLHDDLKSINDLINNINTWKVEKLLATMEKIAYADEKTMGVLAFLVENYNK